MMMHTSSRSSDFPSFQLATKFLSSKFELPQNWWEAVHVNPHVSEAIGNRILDLYEQSDSINLTRVQPSS